MSSQCLSSVDTTTNHILNDQWTLWAHLPHNADWSLKSYIPIMTFKTMEDAISVTESLPPVLVKNCMLFIMKKGINPSWEDPQNREGGSFSYKVANEDVPRTWSELTYRLVGGTIGTGSFNQCVTGITISPKKLFCVVKIWMTSCSHQNASAISAVHGLHSRGCLFMKHKPEY